MITPPGGDAVEVCNIGKKRLFLTKSQRNAVEYEPPSLDGK